MIYISNELSHHGVKGMKWGVRHDPVSTGGRRSSGKKKMSTAKKVAIGVACVAAVAGISYAAVKTGKIKQITRGASVVKNSRVVVNRRKLTGHSQRLTKYGANGYQERFYLNRYNRAAKAGRYHDVGRYGKARQEAQQRLTKDFYAGKHQVFSTKPIKKLKRKAFTPSTFTAKSIGYDYIDNTGQLRRMYGNRSYKIRT